MKTLKLTVDETTNGLRLDIFLAQTMPERSRSFLQKLIASGAVKLKDKICESRRFTVKSGMTFFCNLPEVTSPDVLTEAPFDYEILFEDDQMLVINKPAGSVVHPAAGNYNNTIVNALMSRYPNWSKQWALDDIRPGIVHRLDKDTSGCLVVAKNPQSQAALAKCFADRITTKHYTAIVHGIMRQLSGEVNTLIGRHPVNRQKMAIVERNGKMAQSRYQVKTSGKIGQVFLSVVDVEILTGRTHQIRVHMASLTHPVLGDSLYGGAKGLQVPRQMLHAEVLEIPHPVTGENMRFVSPLPADIKQVIDQLEAVIKKVK